MGFCSVGRHGTWREGSDVVDYEVGECRIGC
jgi:hypothetical protein